MPELVIIAYNPLAAKVTYNLTGPIAFKPTGGAESVTPGVIIEDGDPPTPVAYISGQAFALILIKDERLLSIEPLPAPPSKDD